MMPAKRKAPVLRAAWRDRVRESAAENIGAWLGGAVALVTTLGLAASGVLWILSHLQTVEDAKAHAANDDRRAAWATFGQADLKALVLRNRVNDCAVKTAKAETMTNLEQVACKQYNDEYDQAMKRVEDARHEAMATTKGP
jgi:hypothetical protein